MPNMPDAAVTHDQEHMEKRPAIGQHRLALRVGIHSGPEVAGIIGRSKFSYDV